MLPKRNGTRVWRVAKVALSALSKRSMKNVDKDRYGEQKIAQFRTHDLTKVLSYVSTQSQAKFQWTLKWFKRNVSN